MLVDDRGRGRRVDASSKSQRRILLHKQRFLSSLPGLCEEIDHVRQYTANKIPLGCLLADAPGSLQALLTFPLDATYPVHYPD